MIKRLCRTFVLFALFAFAFSTVVYAQDEGHTLDLGLSRTNGYGGFNGEIQGTFTISASSEGALQSVTFYYNDAVLGEDNEAPFKLQFNTEIMDPGLVNFNAVGYFSDGSTAQSNTIQRTVLSEEAVKEAMAGMLVPILIVVVVIVAGSFLLQLTRSKKGKPFTPGKYSAAGGAVCSKCSMPFSRSVFSPNLLLGKLERCPHCGKFSVRPRASNQALKEAEARYLESAQTIKEPAPEKEKDKLHKMIDDSRFDQS